MTDCHGGFHSAVVIWFVCHAALKGVNQASPVGSSLIVFRCHRLSRPSEVGSIAGSVTVADREIAPPPPVSSEMDYQTIEPP